MSEEKIVFVAIKADIESGAELVGVFEDRDEADARAREMPCESKRGWERDVQEEEYSSYVGGGSMIEIVKVKVKESRRGDGKI